MIIRLLVLTLVFLWSSSVSGVQHNPFSSDLDREFVTDMSVPGGKTEDRAADEEVQQIANQVRAELEQRSGRTFSEYVAITYSTQVVAGINYFIKIRVGKDDYVHVRVFQSLQQEISLSSFQLDKKFEDPIDYF